MLSLDEVDDNAICINYGTDELRRNCDNMFNPECSFYESRKTRTDRLNTLYMDINKNSVG